MSAVSHSLEHVDCPDTDRGVGHVGSDGTDASLAPLTAVFVSLQPVGRWKYIHSYVSERTFMDESKIFYVSVSYLPQSSALAHVDVCAESLDGGGISKPSSLHISPIHQEQLALVVVNVAKPVLEQVKFLIYLFFIDVECRSIFLESDQNSKCNVFNTTAWFCKMSKIPFMPSLQSSHEPHALTAAAAAAKTSKVENLDIVWEYCLLV